MRRTGWVGAAALAAALAACAEKAPDSSASEAADKVPVADTSIDLSDEAAEAADVFAAPFEFDLASIRTKEALTAAADAAFNQADGDGDGALTPTEFYALAALLAPSAPVEGPVDTITDVFSEEGGVEAVVEALPEEPIAGVSPLDESYAAITGADGALTADDLRTAFATKFDAADENLDGALDDAESAALVAGELF